MGLATIDPQSQKEHSKIHRFPSLVLIRLVLTEIQQIRSIKINKEMYRCMASKHCVGVWSAIHFFVHFDIFEWLYLAYLWVYLHQT